MATIGVSAQGRPVGDWIYNAKMTFKKVEELHQLRAQGWTCARLANRYRVHVSTIWKVVTGKAWISPVVKELKSATQDDAPEIAKLAAKGYGFNRIGKRINATGWSVLRVMKANGLHGYHRSVENAKKTECMHGHPLSGDNLYLRPDGNRACKACRRAADKRYKEKSKE